jgi:hypothetical protein
MIKDAKITIRAVHKELNYLLRRPRRLLFNHVPKCAGSTLTEYLFAHYPERLVFETHGRRPLQSVRHFQALPQAERYRYRLVLGHLAHDLLDYIHPDTLTFTVLRHPLDRLISHYFFVRQDRHHYLHQWVMESDISLSEYITSGRSEELQNWYTTHFSGLPKTEIQHNPDQAIDAALNTILDRYDIIGFQDDIMAVTEQVQTSARLFHPFDGRIDNRTPYRLNLADIHDTVQKTLAQANELDLALYALLREKIHSLSTSKLFHSTRYMPPKVSERVS